ncbi:hypothetical protein [Oryzomicrobium sp.]|uniref:hypothetical protein n=1 Tax=Oryzomicrobium sp. TaxID=1911578 RepID=UPI0025FE2F58|nr:hypothetical protein [Oryzomicrobium sp.]MCE1243159.1 hypothetical protein [Oryzomicrobium sp.]
MALQKPTLPQQKLFAKIRIAGGLFATVILGGSCISALANGTAFDGPLVVQAIVAAGAFTYTSYNLRQLAKLNQRKE